MADIVVKKKILEKRPHKVLKQTSSFVEDTSPCKAFNRTAHENCIYNQGNRGRVIIFIDGLNLLVVPFRKG